MDDNKSYGDSIKEGEQCEIIKSTRVDPPAHYTFKINSYSVLSEIGMKKCVSGDFEVDGYHWKLVLYPNGDEKVKDHISLYLAIPAKDKLPLGWEVKAIFRFLIFDQIRDNYLTIQDGKMRKYSKMKSKHGFTHLVSHDTFNKASNGFLVNNCCNFGVEISLHKASNKGESLTIIKNPQHESFFWNIDSFSNKTEYLISRPFNVNGRKWQLTMHPTGHHLVKDSHVSFYIRLEGSDTIPVGKKIYAKFILGAFNFRSEKFIEKSYEYWFKKDSVGIGCREFLSRKDISNHLHNDVLRLKARIIASSNIEKF